MSRVRAVLVSCGGLGYMRPAPGTWGSLPPAGAMFLMLMLGAPPWVMNAVLGVVLVVSCAICVKLGDWAEGHFGKKDASFIVIDETAGQCLALMFWPVAWAGSCQGLTGTNLALEPTLRAAASVAVAFVLFRIMDIVKPPPARGLQRLRGGVGVVIDDLFAGLYAAAVVQILLRVVLVG